MVLQVFPKLWQMDLVYQLSGSRTHCYPASFNQGTHFQPRKTQPFSRVCCCEEEEVQFLTGQPCSGLQMSQQDHPQPAEEENVWLGAWHWCKLVSRTFLCLFHSYIHSFTPLYLLSWVICWYPCVCSLSRVEKTQFWRKRDEKKEEEDQKEEDYKNKVKKAANNYWAIITCQVLYWVCYCCL